MSNPFSLVRNRLIISDSSDSSDPSYQLKPDQMKFFPTSPRCPDKILESMIKYYKIHKTLPSSMVSDLPLDTFKLIVEKLLSEKPDDPNIKHEESADEEKEYEIPSATKPRSSTHLKNQTFRALENVSPIEQDDSERYTNYNIHSPALTPYEETVVNPIAVRSKKYEDYKREILKLAHELKELTYYNQALALIISLDKNNENEELRQQITEKCELLQKLSEDLSESLKKLKKSIQPSEGFLENIQLHRAELKILAEMVGFEKKTSCKPSEMQIINQAMDCCMDDPGNLEKFVDGLLAGHDIAEISLVLVKYIKDLEEQTAVSLKSEALNCLITEIRNDFELEETLNKALGLHKEIQSQSVQRNRIEYEQKIKAKKEQMKLRESPQPAEKPKWQLPNSLSNLSGAELYSKTLAVIKKK